MWSSTASPASSMASAGTTSGTHVDGAGSFPEPVDGTGPNAAGDRAEELLAGVSRTEPTCPNAAGDRTEEHLPDMSVTEDTGPNGAGDRAEEYPADVSLLEPTGPNAAGDRAEEHLAGVSVTETTRQHGGGRDGTSWWKRTVEIGVEGSQWFLEKFQKRKANSIPSPATPADEVSVLKYK